MKQGKSLVELAEEITRQASSKRDFLVDTSQAVVDINGRNSIKFGDHDFELTDHALGQIAERNRIPKKYLDIMRHEAPDLLSQNINHWFQNKSERRMIRTLDGDARAFLSDRYRQLDNDALAEACIPVLHQGGARICSTQITDSRMYIKAIIPSISAEIPGANHVAKHDHVNPGITISNSEIGQGGLTVLPGLHDPECTNLLFSRSDKYVKYHLGGKLKSDDEFGVFSDQTRKLSDAAIFSQLGDITKAILGGEIFGKLVNRLRESKGNLIEVGETQKIVEVAADNYGLNEKEKGSVLEHLIRRGDLTQFGLSSAITRAAEDVESYDRASELESVGGQVIEMNRDEWKGLVAA